MDQPQPYIYDGIFYSSNKRSRSISPISKSNYSNKKNKPNNIINIKTKRLLNDDISNIKITESKKIKIN